MNAGVNFGGKINYPREEMEYANEYAHDTVDCSQPI